MTRLDDQSELQGLPIGALEDKELTLAFQQGDKGAYQTIHDRYRDRVHSVCRRMLGNPSDAQEASQETFLRVYQALGRFNGRYQLGPWITRIATNVCLDHLRSRARRPSDPVPNEILVLDESAFDTDSEPERMMIRDSESRHVRSVLAKLPPMHRAAIVLRDFEGLSYEEVAVALQITECQTKALIHRARQNFKRSWTRSLSVLVPWRLVDRLRGLDSSAREHSTEVITVAQSVGSSCTGVLQQCGQYVGHHVATVVTAAIVGTAAGAASHVATQPSVPETPPRAMAEESSPVAARTHYKVLSHRGLADAKPVDRPTGTQPEAAPSEIEAQAPDPVPSAEPTPSGSASPGPEPVSPSPTAESAPSQSPAPAQPFAAAVGFDYGRPVTSRIPRSHATTVSCTKDYIEQRIETVVEDDDSGATYPAVLQLHWGSGSASDLSLELTVWKNGAEVYYSGTGSLVEGSYPDGQRKMTFLGDYGTMNDRAKSMDLPQSGRFTVGLTLDCAALSVITESVVLGA